MAIFSGLTDATKITQKLNSLGIPLSESTVRARLSEMMRAGEVYCADEGYCLTVKTGSDLAVNTTKRLNDAQLELFAK